MHLPLTRIQILTTLTYMQNSMVDMGMGKVHLCMDMQLFAVTKQVFNNVVVHPGGMHIIQSFLSCIAELMRGSALETYVAAAYGGLTGIFNGKSWVKAMRAFRGVSVALLQQFLSSGQKTFEQIDQYLESARQYPTGRHWVDTFLLPTLLVHQFERAEREGDVHLKQLALKRMMKYFFLAGHVQYARYLTQYLLEMRTTPAEDMVDIVCRHHDRYWNAVSADQFGEQTAIRIGKGGLKGMTLSADLVSEWIDAYPITVHVSDSLDSIYADNMHSIESKNQHKEEFKHRRILDELDRELIYTEVQKYPHPLEEIRPHLYNPVTGQIAPDSVNVAYSVVIGEKMETDYISSLPEGFYKAISSPIKTMDVLKQPNKSNKAKPEIDLESIFLRILMIGQQRQVELAPLFAYELCAVPSSLVDGNGCLRKASKAGIVKRLGVVEILPKQADTVIVDVSQLFYHIVWPHGGYPSDIVASIRGRLNHFPDVTETILVFDKYKGVSAKDHERMRRAGEVVIDYNLSINSQLPKRDVIMKNTNNKRRLATVLSTFDFGEKVTLETPDDGVFGHEEADITMVSYVIEAAGHGKSVIRVLSDDTDVFTLLVYWVSRTGLHCEVQMERWDGTVLNINATCINLGPRCLQLLGAHALSGCDTTSYPYGKGKVSVLKTLLSGEFPGLAYVLGEEGATQEEIVEAAKPFCLALYDQPPGASMQLARFSLFTRKRKNPKVKALPPTEANFLQHVLRAHLQVMLWKAADRPEPPVETNDITKFGWEMRNDIPVPVIAGSDAAPPELIDVIRCGCKAKEKKCSNDTCSCHKQHLSCTSCCSCLGGEGCKNQYTTRQNVPACDEEDADTENILAEDLDIENQDNSDHADAHASFGDSDDEWQ